MTPSLITQLLREIAIIAERAEDRLSDALPAGLQRGQFALLNHLYFTTNRDETPSDLAALHGVTRPAMTQMLGRLRRQGLISLLPSPHDGRSRIVALTDRGRRSVEAVFERLQPDLQALTRVHSPTALQHLLDALTALRHDMEALAPRSQRRADDLEQAS